MIEVHDIAKAFKDVQAVKSVSFNAADNRITALLGPNGAGKSTTLRILASVIKADSGSALVDGCDVATDPMQVRENIGVLPHNSGLYGRLTGIENIRYFGQLQGMRGSTLENRITELVEQLVMGDFADRRTAGFSQGQKIKVALARALVHNPKHVILDEPTNGLDVMATRALRGIIRDLKAEGKCVLFSSHIMQEVDALCDDVIVISHGEVKFDGTIKTLRESAGTEDLEEAFIKLADITEDGL
ncbi:MAG: ATP-binding cassette domain-containing protein [Pseudomonadales bacterium]